MGTHPIFETDFDCLTEMTKPELLYFPMHGFRGLYCRLVLKLGQIDFTNTIIPLGEHKNIGLPMDALPVLKHNGTTICQERAINNHLQSMSTLPDLTVDETVISEQVVEAIHDVIIGTAKPAFVAAYSETEPSKKS